MNPQKSRGRKLKPLVIVVDDHEALRVAVGAYLKSRGFRVLLAGSGEEALEICLRIKRPIDLLITDIHMPRLSGFGLAEEALLIHPEITVVFMSGAFHDHDMPVRNGRRTTFLQKPFTWTIFESTLQSVLGRPPS